MYLFPDDTLLSVNGRAWSDGQQKTLIDLGVLRAWFGQHVFPLNITKPKLCQYLRPITDYHRPNLAIYRCGDKYLYSKCTCNEINKVDLINKYRSGFLFILLSSEQDKAYLFVSR